MSSILQFLKQFNEKQEEEPKSMGETVMNFGRHKGKTYDEIYDTDKQYIKWVITTKDDKYVKRIKHYFIQKIEEDFNYD